MASGVLIETGHATTCTAIVASLVDTNILVYRHDPRSPRKQALANEILRHGVDAGWLCLCHQTLVEFVAATTRPAKFADGTRRPLLTLAEAQQEIERWLLSAPILYPTPGVVRSALRAAAAYQLSWYDAHMLAYAEEFGLPQILSEDFQHGRYYGTVRLMNPFVEDSEVHQLDGVYRP